MLPILLIAFAATPSSNYIRLIQGPQSLNLQTANVQLALRDANRGGKEFTVRLLSTVHLAEAPYYEALQREADENDRVLFELLADESVFETDSSGARRLRVELQPAPGLAALAARNRLTAQVGALDCARDERWVLADVSRRQLAVQEARLRRERRAPPAAIAGFVDPLQRLLRGPFGGGSLTLRVLALCVLPAPEALLLLDDWVASGGATFAPVLRALASAIGRLDWGMAGRLSFAQTLASGEATQQGSLANSLVRWRNSAALDELDRALGAGCDHIAVVYGALHMRDMRAQLQSRYTLVGASAAEWQTAWTLPLPEEPEAREVANSALPLAAAVLSLLALDGADWILVKPPPLYLCTAHPACAHLRMHTCLCTPACAQRVFAAHLLLLHSCSLTHAYTLRASRADGEATPRTAC